MGTSISYDVCENCYNEMNISISKIQSAISDIKEICSNIEKNGVWVGPGAAYYIYLFKELLNCSEKISDNLKTANNYLYESIQNYKEIDAQVARKLFQ